MSKEDFPDRLKNRLSYTDIKLVKRDVTPFIENEKDLEIWSEDYFLQLAVMLRIL